MIEKDSLNPKFVPEKLLEQYSVTEAYVAKLGFLRLELKDSFIKRCRDKESRGAAVDEFISELYTKLSASPHIMEIEPKQEQLFEEHNQGEFGISFWPYGAAMSLGKFLKMRVVMPNRKRKELGLFSWSWNPEEFTVYFDGAMFVVYAPIESIPISTDLGQITRDFIKETIANSEIWRYVEGIGPTPIHPELYVSIVKHNKGNKGPSIQLPIIKATGDHICIFIPENETFEYVTRPLFHDMRFALRTFYSQRLANSILSNAVDELENMNDELSKLVAQYFDSPIYKRFFSSIPRDIRQLIAKMHMSLQEVSSAEIQTQRSKEEAIERIQGTTFLKGIEEYFSRRMKSDEKMDRDAQLSIMNFAAAETSNFAITQATVIAALSGAIIGGLLTAGAQYLFE